MTDSIHSGRRVKQNGIKLWIQNKSKSLYGRKKEAHEDFVQAQLVVFSSWRGDGGYQLCWPYQCLSRVLVCTGGEISLYPATPPFLVFFKGIRGKRKELLPGLRPPMLIFWTKPLAVSHRRPVSGAEPTYDGHKYDFRQVTYSFLFLFWSKTVMEAILVSAFELWKSRGTWSAMLSGSYYLFIPLTTG